MTKIVVWTLQMAKWRIAEQRQLPTLNTTVKSGIKYLAPDWDFLVDYQKSDKSSEAEAVYTRKYLKKLDRLLDEDAERLVEILRMGEVVLMCYCPAGKFCHRYLLVEKLREVAEWFGYEFEYAGELT